MKGMSSPHRIVILGGGFAGIRLARRLARHSHRQHLAVTVISKDPQHVYTPGLYALAGAVTDSARHKAMDRTLALPLRRLFAGLPITLFQATVTGIDNTKNRVTLDDGRTVTYDTLVVALGSETNYYDIPGLQEHARPLKGMRDADQINQAIRNLMRGRNIPIKITVAGGGPTGVEVAAILGETLSRWQAGVNVTLVEAGPTILNGFTEKTQQYVTAQLTNRHVTVLPATPVTRAYGDKIESHETIIPHDILIWTGGIQAPAILQTLPFKKEKGRLVVDGPLHCVAEDEGPTPPVYAIGDAALYMYQGKPVPWTALSALNQADHVANNILRKIRGKKQRIYLPPRHDWVIPLGTTGGIASVMHLPVWGRVIKWLSLLIEIHYLWSIIRFHTACLLSWRRMRIL